MTKSRDKISKKRNNQFVKRELTLNLKSIKREESGTK